MVCCHQPNCWLDCMPSAASGAACSVCVTPRAVSSPATRAPQHAASSAVLATEGRHGLSTTACARTQHGTARATLRQRGTPHGTAAVVTSDVALRVASSSMCAELPEASTSPGGAQTHCRVRAASSQVGGRHAWKYVLGGIAAALLLTAVPALAQEAPSTDTVRDSLQVPTILVNLITPATVIGGVTLMQRTVQSQKESTDAQIAAQKTSTDAQIKAIESATAVQKASTDAQIAAQKMSTDAQIKAIESATAAQKASTDAQIAAINTVADAYRAILIQISTPRASAEKQ
jgi:hypothetical protein